MLPPCVVQRCESATDKTLAFTATPYMRAPATTPLWRGGGLESQTPFDVFTMHDEHTLSGADAMGLTVHHMPGTRCLVFHYSEFHRDQLPLSTPAIRHLFPI